MEVVSGGITAPCGFITGGVHCGIKKNSLDLCMIVSKQDAIATGCFTTNNMLAAPVLVSQQHLQKASACKAIVINSGCANACTGKEGHDNALTMARLTAKQLNVAQTDILICSTGRIGTQLPMNKIEHGIKELATKISSNGNKDASEAILTTDTFAKEYACKVTLNDGKQITIGAMAKGAGMIEPDMATMLAFITTDAVIEHSFLKKALSETVAHSFNKITVDGDTSTNDSVIIMANATAGNKIIVDSSADATIFQEALTKTCHFLAMKILEDGEGATKTVTIEVTGAPDKISAETASKVIANSLLLKVALNGTDVNWGRIIAAVGRGKIKLDPDKVDIYLDDLKIVQNSLALETSMENGKKIWAKKTFKITIDLNNGEAKGICYTCDLSHDYIDINL